MKYSLLAFLVFFFSLSFSQDLFISNGSYVFVDGTAFTSGPDVAPLYVTNDINLETNSHLYLRNEAQVVQGNDVGNSGQGELSVYQEGTVNQWAYNYWCSPVGGILSNTPDNNPFQINQLDDPRLDTTTNLIDSDDSLPTALFQGTASPLVISTRWLWTYVSSISYADWIPSGFNGNIVAGLGFTMKGMGIADDGNTTYDFRGKPNNGTITNTVGTGEFTLVGNPYPSAMDSREFIWDPANIDGITGTLSYWEQDGTVASHFLQDYVGGYHLFTINEDGTVPSLSPAIFFTYDDPDNPDPITVLPLPPTVGMKLAKRYIPIGQGFMVEGKAGTTGFVTTRNSHRVFEKEGTDSFFFRSDSATNSNSSGIQYQDNGLAIVPEDFKRFRVNIDFTVNESQYTRQLVLNFNDSATQGFDYGLELIRSESADSDAYFSFEEKMYSAQAYPFEETLSIPLVVDIEQQQPLRFRIFDIQNFDESQGIYIHDKENGTYVNLRNLNYDLNIEPGNYTDRFEIVFTSETALDVDEFDMDTLTINQNNGIHQLTVLNPKNLNISAIEVYDITGKRLLHDTFDTILNRYEFSTTDLSDGVYIVNVQAQTSAARSQKILVKN